jgi:integrase
MYSDGGGLYLQVTSAGAKSWIFRYWVPQRDDHAGEFIRDARSNKVLGRSREMGLGSFTVVSLDDARERAEDCRRLRKQGIDPIEAQREAKLRAALEEAKAMTFEDAARRYIDAHRAGWRNEKHATQWTSTLATYAYPVMGGVSVQGVDTALVMKAIEPIWSAKTETANRVRGRIEAILDWATVRGFRAGENPARWRGHLDKVLPARSKVRTVKHHAALPYADVAEFMSDLRDRDNVSARALEFTILTAARTGESLGARWDEIDWANKLWTIPAERMKGRRPHVVPLSRAALAMIEGQQAKRASEFIFPGAKSGRALSNMALLELLRGMQRGRLTTHGFRSTFRDWAGDCTNHPRDVIEAALSHAIEDETEAAYRRSTAVEKRRHLMDDWAKYCAKPASSNEKGNVLQLRGVAMT